MAHFNSRAGIPAQLSHGKDLDKMLTPSSNSFCTRTAVATCTRQAHAPACAPAACPWCPGSWARRTCSGRRPPPPPAQSAGTAGQGRTQECAMRACKRQPRLDCSWTYTLLRTTKLHSRHTAARCTAASALPTSPWAHLVVVRQLLSRHDVAQGEDAHTHLAAGGWCGSTRVNRRLGTHDSSGTPQGAS